MRRIRRRRPRVAWFPTFGGARIPEAQSSPFPGIEFELDVDTSLPNGDVFVDAVPLTFDTSQSAVEAQGSPTDKTLRDIVQGNEWRLRRIVGKCFLNCAGYTQGDTVATLADVALGFIVCKTYDDGVPITDFTEVNPLSQESMEDPWIWRRRWLLSANGDLVNTAQLTADVTNNAAYWGYPASNVRYGSVLDGPHIDAKSNRTIHRSERLFAVLAARKFNNGGAINYRDFVVRGLLDYRLLGSLKSQQYGNRGNMAR